MYVGDKKRSLKVVCNLIVLFVKSNIKIFDICKNYCMVEINKLKKIVFKIVNFS